MPAAIKPIIERAPLSEALVHPNPLINRVLVNRGVESMEDLKYGLAGLLDPFLLKNMKQAAELLEKHLKLGSRIVIVGDFDCDGATSTSVGVEGLRLLGFKDVNYLIPDRVKHGYGLTPSIVHLAGEMEPDLIITVDNGIASLEGAREVAKLKSRTGKRVELLITDHHLPLDSGELPPADSIVNPSQPDCTFPSKAIAGCGVMFYTVMALRSHLRDVGHFEAQGIKPPSILQLLDLVALGTVADVVALDRNNRILVDAGIRWIKAGHGRPGIRALLEIGKRDPSKLVAQDFGFAVGPRINAAGRLEGMDQGIECLLTTDYEQAVSMAQRLDELNLKRRDIEADHVIDANHLIETNKLNEMKGVVIHDPTWHPGVVGILASRIKEKLNRPVICMTDTEEAGEHRAELSALEARKAPADEIKAARKALGESYIKGSSRSIKGVHLKHVLDEIASHHPDVLDKAKFGGHAMAAGLGVKEKNLVRFIELFNEAISHQVTEDQLLGSIEVDIKDVDPQYLTMQTAQELQDLGPWGQLFPDPVFHGKFKMVSHRILGEKHLKMTVSVVDHPNEKFEAIAFGCVQNQELPVGETFDASFSLDINSFRGNETLQLKINALQDPVMEQRKALLKDQVAATEQAQEREAQARSKRVEDAYTVLETPAGVEAVDSKIKGLKNTKRADPVERLREDMQDVLKRMKQKNELQADSSPSP